MIFRYPGSKQKFLGTLTPFLDRLVHGRKAFHDVFTGSGAVALFMAKRHPRLELHLNELDADLSAFWSVIVSKDVDELCGRLRIKPTIDLFHELRSQTPGNRVDRAFRALFFNRCSFSGLLDGSPLGGWRQMSPNKIFTRYNHKQLVKGIRETHQLLAGRAHVTCFDGVDYVERHPNATLYCDPPYFEKGDVLFRQRMTLDDHLRLARALRHASNWLLSYDRSPVIEELYSWAERHAFAAQYSVNGKKQAWATSEELVIFPSSRSRLRMTPASVAGLVVGRRSR